MSCRAVLWGLKAYLQAQSSADHSTGDHYNHDNVISTVCSKITWSLYSGKQTTTALQKEFSILLCKLSANRSWSGRMGNLLAFTWFLCLLILLQRWLGNQVFGFWERRNTLCFKVYMGWGGEKRFPKCREENNSIEHLKATKCLPQ